MDPRHSLPILLLASALLSACSAAPSAPLAPIEPQEVKDPRVEDLSMRVGESAEGIFSLMGGFASGPDFFVGASLSKENFDLFDPATDSQQQQPPAQQPPPPPPPPAKPAGGFTVAVEPYFWWVGSEGNANIGAGGSRVHTSVDATWESMDAAWGLRSDMGPEPGPYRILFDMNYQSISKDARNGSFHAYHSMFEGDVSWRTTDKYLFDPLVGVRYTELDAIRIFDTTDTAVGESRGWFDPVIGARGRIPLVEKLDVAWRADVGGFGVGSDLTVQLDGAFYWSFSRQFSGFVGWRYLNVDYTSSNLDYHVATTGPYCGLTIVF
jgi:hypothetical protein